MTKPLTPKEDKRIYDRDVVWMHPEVMWEYLLEDFSNLKFGLDKIKYDRERLLRLEGGITTTMSREEQMRVLGGTEKEKNWGVKAGLAHATLGPIAGVSTALQTEAKNVEIRKRNAAQDAAAAALIDAMGPIDVARSHSWFINRIKAEATDDEFLIMDTSEPMEKLYKELSVEWSIKSLIIPKDSHTIDGYLQVSTQKDCYIVSLPLRTTLYRGKDTKIDVLGIHHDAVGSSDVTIQPVALWRVKKATEKVDKSKQNVVIDQSWRDTYIAAQKKYKQKVRNSNLGCLIPILVSILLPVLVFLAAK